MGDQVESRLEPFLLLAKSAKGAAAAKVIQDATSANGVYVFADLLRLPNIQELSNDTTYAKHFALLQLFEYGTFSTYSQSFESYPPLNAAQLAKLKQLTLVSLASQNRALPYDALLPALDIPDERALENMIIETIYSGLLRGKMHHYEKVLHVDWVAGRSPSAADLQVIKQRLDNWCANAETLLSALDEEIQSLKYKSHVDAQHRADYATERDKRFVEAHKEAQSSGPSESKFFRGGPGALGSRKSKHEPADLSEGTPRTRKGLRRGEGDMMSSGSKEAGEAGGRLDKNGRSADDPDSPRRSKRSRD